MERTLGNTKDTVQDHAMLDKLEVQTPSSPQETSAGKTTHGDKPTITLATPLNDKYNEALQVGRALIGLARDTPEKPQTATFTFLYNLASSYGSEGQTLAAKGLLTAMLEAREKGHTGGPGMSNIRAQMALILYELGDYHEAAELVALDGLETFFDIHSQDTASLQRMHDLLDPLSQNGLHDQSIPIARYVLMIKRARFGDGHETIAALCILGRMYCRSGDAETALKLMAESVLTSKTLRGTEDQFTLLARYNLALVYYKQGKLQLAKEECASIADGLRDALGSDHHTYLGCQLLLSKIEGEYNGEMLV